MYLIHRKFDALYKFTELKRELENGWINILRHFDHIKVVSVCLVDLNFFSLREYRIISQFSAPRTPLQNRVKERNKSKFDEHVDFKMLSPTNNSHSSSTNRKNNNNVNKNYYDGDDDNNNNNNNNNNKSYYFY